MGVVVVTPFVWRCWWEAGRAAVQVKRAVRPTLPVHPPIGAALRRFRPRARHAVAGPSRVLVCARIAALAAPLGLGPAAPPPVGAFPFPPGPFAGVFGAGLLAGGYPGFGGDLGWVRHNGLNEVRPDLRPDMQGSGGAANAGVSGAGPPGDAGVAPPVHSTPPAQNGLIAPDAPRTGATDVPEPAAPLMVVAALGFVVLLRRRLM